MSKIYASGEQLLNMIELAMSKPAGSISHIDIIHTSLCAVSLDDECGPLDCDCEPEYKERTVN